ncbi:hypothetical protein AB7M35_002137 [Amorphus suaedae]
MKIQASLAILGLLGAPLAAAAAPSGLTDECKELYEAYQTAETPKAFATGPDGACGWAWEEGMALDFVRQKAVSECQEHTAGQCLVVEQVVQ